MKTSLIAALGCVFALSCAAFAQEVPDTLDSEEQGRVYEIKERPAEVTRREESFDKPSEIRSRPATASVEVKRVIRKPPPKPAFDATMPMANEMVTFRR